MVLEGSGAFEQAGRSIEFIGDFDGDSYGDFLVGAYRGDGSGAVLSYTGEAYVIYGDASGNLPTTLTLGTGLTGTNGFSLVGIDADDFTGNHVSGAGDVNGDGFADILIGAYNADGASNALSTAGTAFVVFGGATGTVDTSGTFNLSSLNGSTGFAVHGSATFDNVGFESASAGDVNGDGLDDVIIGVPGGGTNGDAYVVFGQTSAFSAEFDVTASGLFKFNGTTSVSGGYNVSAAGDVNGDGYDDFLISQHRVNSNAGDGHLIFGGENLGGVTVNQGTLAGLAVGAGGGFTISGGASSDYAGRAMSSAGDFNGDGYDDILIGSPGNQSDPNYNGYSYVVFGGASLTSGSGINLANIDGTNGIKFIGVAYGDEAGYFVGSAGDVNGDGFDDIIVSTPDADPSSLSYAGTVYVVYGGNFSGGILFQGTAAAETSVGTTAAEVMIGGLGADTLTGGGGADVLRGGGDDDVLNVNDLTFLKVDGVGGTDTLGLDKAGAVIDLTTIANNKIRDIEVLDLNGTLNSTLTISAAEVLALSDTSNTIKITGNIGDSVQTTDAGWVFTGDLGAPENGFDFHIFTNGAATMHVSHALTHQGIGDLPTIISIADVVVSEEAGFVTVTLTRSGDVSGTSTVDFSMTGGTATAGTDFTVFAGGINFFASSTSQTLNIAITDDAVFEAPETFVVNLSNAVNAVIVDDEATVTIIDRLDLDTLNGANGFTIVGDLLGGYSGFSVSGAGDVNGDGFADVVVGAPYGSSLAGASYVVFGDDTFGAFVDLAALYSAGSVAAGLAASDKIGMSGSSAGDFNGDGVQDFILGAPGSAGLGDATGANAGEAYLIFGNASGLSATINPATLSGTDGFVLYGTDAGDNFGKSVASAGDINGDGYDDLVIGALAADGSANITANTGEAYVVFGGATVGNTGTLDLSTLAAGNGSAGFVLFGASTTEQWGHSVGSPGDINGDGLDDFAVSAPFDDTTAANAGRAIVVFGTTTLIAAGDETLVNLAAAGGFDILGAASGDWAGNSVSGAGDLNGDGFDDIIVGAPYADPSVGPSAGESYVVFGGASLNAIDVALGSIGTVAAGSGGGFTISGGGISHYSGHSVSTAGDFNGDGFDDLIIGAHGDGSGDAGYAFVMFGGSGLVPGSNIDLGSLTGTNGIQLVGEIFGDKAGFSVSGAGDVNGDGFDDLIVGSPYADPGTSNEGLSHVVFGFDVASEVTHQGTASGDTLTGTIAADVMVGGLGNDTLVGTGGADVMRGGAGNDVLAIQDATFQRIDGGSNLTSGSDTLRLDGAVDLNLTTLANNKITGIEAIDITGAANNTLTLGLQDILDLSGTSNTLQIDGNSGDAVVVSDGVWSLGTDQVINSVTYTLYTLGAATLLVDNALYGTTTISAVA